MEVLQKITQEDSSWGAVFTKINSNMDSIKAAIDLGAICLTSRWISTEGQTEFTLPFEADIGKNRVEVYVDGIAQYVGVNFEETSTTLITLTEGLESNQIVHIKYIKK